MTISLDRRPHRSPSPSSVGASETASTASVSAPTSARRPWPRSSALLEHKVIFFRGQNHLDDEARSRSPSSSASSRPRTRPSTWKRQGHRLSPRTKGMAAGNWHTDVTFVDRIPAISVLRGVAIPAYGGTATGAGTVTAYEHPAGPAEGSGRQPLGRSAHQRLRLRARRRRRARSATTRTTSSGARSSPGSSSRTQAPGGRGCRRPASARWCWATS